MGTFKVRFPLFELKSLSSSYSRSCSSCCISAFRGVPSLPTLRHLSGPATRMPLPCPTSRPSANYLTSHPRLQTDYHPVSLQPSSTSGFSMFPTSSPASLRILHWNAGGLRAGSVQDLHFVLLFPVDLSISRLTLLHFSGSVDGLLYDWIAFPVWLSSSGDSLASDSAVITR